MRNAKVTVTLQSGKKATLKVKVQTARVNTTKISGLKKNVSLKKGQKLTLKPAISPLTSQDKVTYTSSNKKVATVSKKGLQVLLQFQLLDEITRDHAHDGINILTQEFVIFLISLFGENPDYFGRYQCSPDLLFWN